MAIQKVHVTTTLQEKFLVETEARGHKITVDEPLHFGGTDKGQTPVELILSGLGACQSIVVQHYAKQFGINFENLHIELEGELDLDGFLNKSNVRPGFSNITATYHITTDAPQDKLDEFFTFVEKHCPVGDTLVAPVQLSSKVVVNNLVK